MYLYFIFFFFKKIKINLFEENYIIFLRHKKLKKNNK
jgi:hypothetical protein